MDNPYQTPQSLGVTANAPSASYGQVPDQVIRALQGTRGWVRFLAVLGFISTTFMVLGSIGIMVTMNRGMFGELAMMFGLVYFVFAVLNFFAAFKLNQYASRISALLMARSELSLVEALDAQRGFWKYVGIMAIIVIGLYLLAIGSGVIFR